MLRYVVDSYAWVEYFRDTEKGVKFGKIIDSEDSELFTLVITVAEVSSIFKREGRNAEEAYIGITTLSKIYGIIPEFAKEAGILYAEIRKRVKDFGMADSVALSAARKLGAKIVTGDPHFKGFKEAVLI